MCGDFVRGFCAAKYFKLDSHDSDCNMQMRFLSILCENKGKVGDLKEDFVREFVRRICAGNSCGDFLRGIYCYLQMFISANVLQVLVH